MGQAGCTAWLLGWLLKLHCLGSCTWLAVFSDLNKVLGISLSDKVCFVFFPFPHHLQDASSSDIRKAYRKLSLTLHPDKNKDENAETQFRQVSEMSCYYIYFMRNLQKILIIDIKCICRIFPLENNTNVYLWSLRIFLTKYIFSTFDISLNSGGSWLL